MDNQLIFWYRRMNVRVEICDAKNARSLDPFGVMVVESLTRALSRLAAEGRRKVAHPGRWLSRAKCVALRIGKSVLFLCEA